MRALLIGMLLSALAVAAEAGVADVLDVRVMQELAGTYRFDVTVRHDDTSWDHYADRWEVVTPDGTVLAVRTLLHPHVNEQPFTRSLLGVTIAPGTDRVTLRAHDKVHGLGGAEIEVELP